MEYDAKTGASLYELPPPLAVVLFLCQAASKDVIHRAPRDAEFRETGQGWRGFEQRLESDPFPLAAEDLPDIIHDRRSLRAPRWT